MGKPDKPVLFRAGDIVTYRAIVTSEVVGYRWVDLGPGQSGVWKYRLEDGTEMTGSGLTIGQRIDFTK